MHDCSKFNISSSLQLQLFKPHIRELWELGYLVVLHRRSQSHSERIHHSHKVKSLSVCGVPGFSLRFRPHIKLPISSTSHQHVCLCPWVLLYEFYDESSYIWPGKSYVLCLIQSISFNFPPLLLTQAQWSLKSDWLVGYLTHQSITHLSTNPAFLGSIYILCQYLFRDRCYRSDQPSVSGNTWTTCNKMFFWQH
jgi:hypothetical protein